MKKILLTLLLGALPLCAQVPAPQVPLTGTVGAGGLFPLLNTGSVSMTSDANRTLTYPETTAYSFSVTSSVSLTATRNVVGPLIRGTYTVSNATTGGQSIQLIGATGSGVTIPNGATYSIYCDGTNYSGVQVFGAAGGDLTGNYPNPTVANVGAVSGSPGTGGVPVHASTLKVDNMAGSGSNDLLATTDNNGDLGPSQVSVPPNSIIPSANVLGFVTVQGNAQSFTGTTSSTSSVITAVSSFTNLVVGQPLLGSGMPTGATIGVLNPGASTITIWVSGSPVNATMTGTTVPLLAALGGATMSFTTGITAACGGGTTACLFQQINIAPCATAGTVPANTYSGGSVMTVSSLTCYSMQGVGFFQAPNFSVWCSWTGQNAGSSQLTGVTCGGFWHSAPTTITSLVGNTANFYQVNIAYSTATNISPFEFILQNGDTVYGYTPATNLTFCTVGGVQCYWTSTEYHGTVEFVYTPGTQLNRVAASGGFIHDDFWLTNVAGSGQCTAEQFYIGDSWHFGSTMTGPCTIGTNGIQNSEFYWLNTAPSQQLSNTASIVPQMQLSTKRLHGNVAAEFPEYLGSGSSPSISFTTGTGSMYTNSSAWINTNLNGTFQVATVGTGGLIQFTLSAANGINFTASGNTTSATLNFVSSMSGLTTGATVTGPGIAGGTTILSLGTNAITLSANPSAITSGPFATTGAIYTHRMFCNFTDETQASADATAAAAGVITPHFVHTATSTTNSLTAYGFVVANDIISYQCTGN